MNLKFKLIKRFPILGKYFNASWGFIPEELKETDYTLGASPLSKKILQPNSDWTEFLPSPERQSGRNIETMACVSFSFLNVLEALFKRKYNIDINFSDRFLAKASGTGSNGNVQSRVADTARKTGLVLEEDYPSNMDEFSWNEYYKQLTPDLFEKAKKFLNDYEIGYEAVTPNLMSMQEALKYSPLWCAVYAWYSRGGIYYEVGNPNHCVTLYDIEDVVAYKKLLDQYEPFLKKYDYASQIYYPKILTLNKKGETFNIGEITRLIKRGFKYILRSQAAGEIYELTIDGLKYISPEEWNDINVRLASDQKLLTGVSETDYQKLLS